jgi:hypothetical protein
MAELILEPYAVSQRWRLPAGADGRWEIFLAEYLENLARRCAEHEGCVIGHIKAVALFPGRGYVQVSAVSHKLPAQVNGRVPSGCVELSLSLNVIVYGLNYERLERLTRATAADLAAKWKGEMKIEATSHRPSSDGHIHPNHLTKEHNDD